LMPPRAYGFVGKKLRLITDHGSSLLDPKPSTLLLDHSSPHTQSFFAPLTMQRKPR
jgi:hypothetical protein